MLTRRRSSLSSDGRRRHESVSALTEMINLEPPLIPTHASGNFLFLYYYYYFKFLTLPISDK